MRAMSCSANADYIEPEVVNDAGIAKRVGGHENLARLRKLKAQYDPGEPCLLLSAAADSVLFFTQMLVYATLVRADLSSKACGQLQSPAAV